MRSRAFREIFWTKASRSPSTTRSLRINLSNRTNLVMGTAGNFHPDEFRPDLRAGVLNKKNKKPPPHFAVERGKPAELPNLPKRVSVDELLQTRLVMTVKRAWRKLRRAAAA